MGTAQDDSRFVTVGSGTGMSAGTAAPARFGKGSSGLVGPTDAGPLFDLDGDRQPDVDTTPEYLRWGWWAASYDVVDGTTGQPRTDTVPLGTFMIGNHPDPSELPTSGVARYEGLAVGTMPN